MSEIAKHTPGPWKLVPAMCESEDWTVGVGERVVANVVDARPRTGESHANARLIAAAPDLLAELEETARWLDAQAAAVERIGNEYARAGGHTRRAAARLRGRAQVLRQVILKAKGLV